jgi:hypothetical protein
MILASDVFSDVQSYLDDDNSGRYDTIKDLAVPLNGAVSFFMNVFAAAFAQKKVSEETLRDLCVTKILTVTGTNTKKADLSTIVDLWKIWGVEPDPIVLGSPSVLSEPRNRFAARLTIEQWDDSLQDPFSPGTGVSIHPDFVRPSYVGPAQFFGDGKLYLMIRPASVFTANNVCIYYLKNPTKVISGASQVEFPYSMRALVVDKTLQYMSRQHGPESVLGKISEKDVMQLLQTIL